MPRIGWVSACALCAALLGCGRSAPPAAGDRNSEVGERRSETSHATSDFRPPTSDLRSPRSDLRSPDLEKLPVEHLPNAIRVTENVISGGLPEGEAAFQELERLGVRTIISVDGMTPDVEAARRHGMRYVHLPHGYDQVPAQRGHELAKAVRELPGPIYIHCHHGKHRSPAATAVACVEAGLIARDAAEAILKTAGTSENYRGLYASARNARLQAASFLDSLEVEFREVAAIPPLADAMVALEQTHDRVRQIVADGGTGLTPPPASDLDPAHEALLLREHFAELLRMDEVKAKPEPFREYVRASETAARQLEEALNESPPAGDAAKSALDAINVNCTACHREYRDNL